MPVNPSDASELLLLSGIRTEEDLLARIEAEKNNLITVSLVWRTREESPTGFSGWELVRHGVLTGDPVADRRFNGNRFFHRAELAEALDYVERRYGIHEMVQVPGFPRSKFPRWVRIRALAWIRQTRKIYS